MSKVLKTVGVIAGSIALIATGVGAFAAAGSALAATAGSVATYATLAASVANIGAALTSSYKPPPAAGSITRVLIDPQAPQPYVMGEGYYSGILRHDCAYGATIKKVPNPYRWMVMVYSGGGPIESITPYVDQGAVPGWYTGYLSTDTQLGDTPESSALSPPLSSPAPGWTTSSKLSGQAAIGWNLKFDKDGERFAAGLPQLGAYGQWVKVYDPRLDSTRSGGSGSHRVDDETTWEYSANPALHAGVYAYGRYQNSVRTFGVGLPDEAIDWDTIIAWANVCDSNSWTIFGVIYEPASETRWPNLKEIAAAGGAVPIFAGGVLSFKYSAPKVALDTFTEDDLAEGPQSVTAMLSRRSRLNTIIPKYRSASHNWEMVPAAAAVTDATYVTEDGEERRREWPFNLVKDKDQAAALAAYKIADSRELQPITLTFGHRVRAYKPGDCVELDIPSLALATDAVILTRNFNPLTLTTTFTFISETAAKHAWALGQSATAPPTATLTPQTAQERDELTGPAQTPNQWFSSTIRSAKITTTATRVMNATDAGADVTLTIEDNTWDYPGNVGSVTRGSDTITGLSYDEIYYVYFDDETLEDTAPTYYAVTDLSAATNVAAFPYRHFLGSIGTPSAGGNDRIQQTNPPGYIGDQVLPTSQNEHLAAIRGAFIENPRTTGDVATNLVTASWFSGSAIVQVARHDWNYPDNTPDITREFGTILSLSLSTRYYIYFDDEGLDDTAPTYYATTDRATALPSTENPYRHYLGQVTTPASAGSNATNNAPGVGDNALAAADAAANVDGTIRTDRVSADAIIEGEINVADWDEQTGQISIGTSDQSTNILFTGTAIDADRVVVDVQYIYKLDITNPTEGTDYELDVSGFMDPDGGSAVYSEVYTESVRWQTADDTGSFSTEWRLGSRQFTFDSPATDDHDIGIRFQTPASNGATMYKRYIRISQMKAQQ